MELQWKQLYKEMSEQQQICFSLQEQLKGYDYLVHLHKETADELKQLKKKNRYFLDFFPHRRTKRRFEHEKKLHKIAVLEVKIEDLEERVDYYGMLQNEYNLELEKEEQFIRQWEHFCEQMIEKNKNQQPEKYENYGNCKKTENEIQEMIELIQHALWEMEGAEDIETLDIVGGSIAQVVIEDYYISVENDLKKMREGIGSRDDEIEKIIEELLEKMKKSSEVNQEKFIVDFKSRLRKIEELFKERMKQTIQLKNELVFQIIDVSEENQIYKEKHCERTV